MFKTKDFHSVVAGMVRHMRATQDKVTDFHVGGVARTLVEAPAIEIDEFYQRVLYGLLEAIPTAVYHAFGFDALPAAHAGGIVRFSATTTVASSVPIPAGAIVVSPATNRRYMTESASEIPAGQSYADVRVTAEFPGIAGNMPAMSVTQLLSQIGEVTSVANLDLITGGKDAESDDERRERFIYYVGSLSRGTVWALNYAAKSALVRDGNGTILEYVDRVGVDEGAGRVDMYLLGSHGEASDGLIAAAQLNFDGSPPTLTRPEWTPGYRSAGVEVTARKMVIRFVDVVVSVGFVSDRYQVDADLIASARSALDAKLAATLPGTIIYADELIASLLSLKPVFKVVLDVDENIECMPYEQLRLGALNISEIQQ